MDRYCRIQALTTALFVGATLAVLSTAPAVAQEVALTGISRSAAPAAAPADSTEATNVEPSQAEALNQFEAPKQSTQFAGIQLDLGGSFTMNLQALDHSNTAEPNIVDGKNLNELGAIRAGVNLPTANLQLGVKLAPGISMTLESYMSSRHHNEFWVKGGYATIDASPINVPVLNRLMEYVTVRAGMYEPNYGDAHYRRSDNGNTIRNPFAENYILDAFTTEPGADVMVRVGDAFVMGGATTGQNKGDVKDGAVDARPAFLAKAGLDRQVRENLRLRLSGSMYTNSSSPAGTLYGGDRAGSNYWGVVDNEAGSAFTNGRVNPGFRNEVTAFQLNPFVKVGSLELFGVIETASGKAAAETERRDIRQYAGDAVYRLLDDKLYVAGRYNLVKGDFEKQTDLRVNRTALAAGWFISPNILTKVEYVRQSYDGFAATDIRNGAKFSGFVVQGAISF